MTAELSARRTAAAAVAGDFKRATDAYLDAGGPYPDFDSWAWRLHTQLRSLLEQIDADMPATLADLGQQVILRQALTDAIAWRNPVGLCEDCDASPSALCLGHSADLDQCDAYIALARSLGIDLEEEQ